MLEQLTQELDIAKQHEANLEGQVKKLEVALSDHQTAVKALKQMDKLKAELDQTKKDALKLAKENKRLQKQVTDLQAGQQQKQQQAAAIVPAPPPTAPVTRYRSLPSRPVMPDRESAKQRVNTKSFDTWCYD